MQYGSELKAVTRLLKNTDADGVIDRVIAEVEAPL
jgi:hypothetical protein